MKKLPNLSTTRAEPAATVAPAPQGAASPDPARCPLCGGPNGCAVCGGRPIGACWCLSASVPRELRERIPPERRGRACVCAACVADWHARQAEPDRTR